VSSHLNDEEQLEALKRWWREHGVQWLLIIVVGVGAWFGWNAWQDNREARHQAASLAYTNFLNQVSQSSERDAESLEALHSVADALRDEFSGTAYAHYTAMLQARLAVEAEDYDAAADYLRMVIDSRADEATALLARVRLARVLGSAGKADEGLRVLDAVEAKHFAPQFAEVRGDLLILQGDRAGAAEAYTRALELGGASGGSPLLQLKLSRVAPSEPEALQGDLPSQDRLPLEESRASQDLQDELDRQGELDNDIPPVLDEVDNP